MVLRPNNFAKQPANENQPPAARPGPSLNSKGLVSRLGLGDAAHRRRSRTSGMTRTPKYIVEQAKRRGDNKTKKSKTSLRFTVTTVPTMNDIEMADGSPSMPRARTFPINLPKELSRPEYKPINLEVIEAVDPTLADTDLDYLRDSVEVLGSE